MPAGTTSATAGGAGGAGGAPTAATSGGAVGVPVVLPNVFAKPEAMVAVAYIFANKSLTPITDATAKNRAITLASKTLTTAWLPQVANVALKSMWTGVMNDEAKARTLGLIIHEMNFRPDTTGGAVAEGTLSHLVVFDLATHSTVVDADLANADVTIDAAFASNFANLSMLSTWGGAVQRVCGATPLVPFGPGVMPPPPTFPAPTTLSLDANATAALTEGAIQTPSHNAKLQQWIQRSKQTFVLTNVQTQPMSIAPPVTLTPSPFFKPLQPIPLPPLQIKRWKQATCVKSYCYVTHPASRWRN